jgi:hypothetical protein
MSCHIWTGQNYAIKTASKSFESMTLKIFRNGITNENYILEEVKSRLNLGQFLLPLSLAYFVFPSHI